LPGPAAVHHESAVTRHVVRLSFAAAIAARLLFLVTLPLNDVGGDSSNYFSMLRDGTSSLVHAGGYPFLIGLPFRIHVVQRVLDAIPGAFSYAVLLTQHAVDLAALLVAFGVVSRIFGRLTGALVLLFAGTNFQSLGATSSVYPEWLQADLLIFYLAALYYAYSRRDGRTKLVGYALAGFVFAWCILVKFNAAPIAFVAVAAILFDSLTLVRKTQALLAFGLALALVMVPYVALHHRPSTGTTKLTEDAAWVLLTRIETAYGNVLDPANSLNTRRWLALSRVLPRSYEFAGPGMFSHVDAVPETVRAPYRARFGYLLTANDDSLRPILANSELPPGFVVGLSPIPVAYYLGLPESDGLGVQVALDAVRAQPARFAAVVWSDIKGALRSWPRYAPFPESVAMLDQFSVTVRQRLPLGYVRVNQRPDFPSVPFSYTVPVLWWPGVQAIDVLLANAPSMDGVLLLAALAVLWAIVRIVWFRAADARAVTILLLGTIVVGMVVFSVSTLSFRWKEARLLIPIVSILAAAGAGLLIGLVQRLWTTMRARAAA
jgi:hypothetical protein